MWNSLGVLFFSVRLFFFLATATLRWPLRCYEYRLGCTGVVYACSMIASLNAVVCILLCYAGAVVQGLVVARVALPFEMNRHQSCRRSKPTSGCPAARASSRQAGEVSPLGATSGAQTPPDGRSSKGSEGIRSTGFGSRASRRRKGILGGQWGSLLSYHVPSCTIIIPLV